MFQASMLSFFIFYFVPFQLPSKLRQDECCMNPNSSALKKSAFSFASHSLDKEESQN